MSGRLVVIEGIRFFGRQRVCQWVAEAIRRVRQQRVAPAASPTGVRKRQHTHQAEPARARRIGNRGVQEASAGTLRDHEGLPRVAPVASPTGVRKRHRPYFALSEQVALEGHATAWPGRATGRTRQSASLQV